METIRALIIRLQQQSDQQASPTEMLATVQMLQSALQQSIVEPVRQVRSGNISVVFPSGNRLVTSKQPEAPQESQTPLESQTPQVVQSFQAPQYNAPANTPVQPISPLPAPEQPSVKPAPEGDVPDPVIEFGQEERSVQEKTVSENFHLSFNTDQSNRKHSQQMDFREMNDIFGQSSSLNDRLKGDHQEVGSALHEEPVKDLRRAIGINDRFVYLNELFRGDEVMYERSLKTINNFRIYPEAEYWIERELKVKLGWDESKETVKQFRQLVRRRFQV